MGAAKGAHWKKGAKQPAVVLEAGVTRKPTPLLLCCLFWASWSECDSLEGAVTGDKGDFTLEGASIEKGRFASRRRVAYSRAK